MKQKDKALEILTNKYEKRRKLDEIERKKYIEQSDRDLDGPNSDGYMAVAVVIGFSIYSLHQFITSLEKSTQKTLGYVFMMVCLPLALYFFYKDRQEKDEAINELITEALKMAVNLDVTIQSVRSNVEQDGLPESLFLENK